MNDMHFAAIRIAEICAIISFTIMQAGARFPGIRAARRQSRSIRPVDGRVGRRFKSNHRSIARSRWCSVERCINIKARQLMTSSNPATCLRSPVRLDYALSQPERREQCIVKDCCTFNVIGSECCVTEHEFVLIAAPDLAGRLRSLSLRTATANPTSP